MNNTNLQLDKQLNDYQGNYYVYNDNEEFYTARLPYVVKGVKLNKTKNEILNTLKDAINNCYILNTKHTDKKHMLNYYRKQLKNRYVTLIDDKEIMSIIDNTYTNFDKLTPANPINKTIWINPDTTTNKKTASNMAKRDVTTTTINYYFTNLINFETQKVTYDVIANELDLSLRTIKSYLTPEHKNIIKEFNSNLKAKAKVKAKAIEPQPIQPIEIEPEPIQPKEYINYNHVDEDELCDVFENYILTYGKWMYNNYDDAIDNIPNHFNYQQLLFLIEHLDYMFELLNKPNLHNVITKKLNLMRFDYSTADAQYEYEYL